MLEQVCVIYDGNESRFAFCSSPNTEFTFVSLFSGIAHTPLNALFRYRKRQVLHSFQLGYSTYGLSQLFLIELLDPLALIVVLASSMIESSLKPYPS